MKNRKKQQQQKSSNNSSKQQAPISNPSSPHRAPKASIHRLLSYEKFLLRRETVSTSLLSPAPLWPAPGKFFAFPPPAL
ncbi:hypothetical protein Peur_002806 [Populus x canadensis]